MRASFRSLPPFLAVLAFCAPPLLAGEAPSKAQQDADTAEVGAYKLSLPTLHKVAQTFKTLDTMVAKDPGAFREKLDRLEVAEDAADSPVSLEKTVAKVESVPEFKRALAAAGLSSREYVVFSLTLLVAAVSESLVGKTGKLPPDATPTLAENIKWYQAHRAEVEQFTREMEALGSKYEEPEGDEEQGEGAGVGDEDPGDESS